MNRLISIISGLAALVLVIYFSISAQFVSWDFSNNLWAPAYLITHGESAYNINLIFADSNSIWFPQIIGLFFFLGFLPQHLATNVWLILNIALLLALILYFLRQSSNNQKTPLYFGILALSVFLFPPTIRHLILGQVDILLIAALIAGVYSIEKKQLMLGGFLFALALVKPQHCIVVLPSVFIYLLFARRAWQDILKLFLATLFFVIFQTLPLWFGSLNWFVDFLLNLHRNPGWIQPNIFSMLYNRFGAIGFAFWMVIYVTIIVINFRIWLKNKPEKGVLWGLASTAIISPYLWSWDFVLLLPLFVDTAIRLENLPSKIILAAFYAICFFGSIFSLQGGAASDEVLWWLPFVLIIGIVSSISVDKMLRQKEMVLL